MAIPEVSDRSLEGLWSLRDRVAVVTGGGRGIGAATAFRLAEAGASVVVTDISSDAAEAVATAVAARHDVPTRSHAADVAADGALDAVARAVVGDLGAIDIWVNNAGIFPKRGFLELDAGAWDEVQAVNARGTFLGTHAAAGQMVAAGRGGVIVNIASVAGLRGGAAGYSHYVASKHAVVGFTKALASELGPHGIRALGVAPSAVETAGILESQDDGGRFFREYTSAFPLGRHGVADDIARVVVFLASDMAVFMTGTTLVVDGGNTAR